MTGFRRPRALLLVLTGLLAFDGWAVWRWMSSHSEAAAAQAQLAAIDQLAQQIKRLQAAPIVVDERVRSNDSLAKLVESACRQSSLDTERIAHVAPGAPRRIGDSPYEEQATDVELRGITVQQCIACSLAIEQLAPGVHIPVLALRVAPGEPETAAGPELWNAQAILTSYIYAPTIPAPR